MPKLKESELILNPDSSIYHLQLKPGEVADTIITVGDPDRVKMVTSHFDNVEFTKQKREFCTQTGSYKGKRITVISTGIGTDNIDIVFTELDALFNIDLKTREIKTEHHPVSFIRIGTSGSMQESIPVDSYLASSFGLGMDGLLHYYQYEPSNKCQKILNALPELDFAVPPYLVEGSTNLINKLADGFHKGITCTCTGFYGPQGRALRLKPKKTDLLDILKNANPAGNQITNFEMETAGIYAMASLLGHEAISINAILANRALGQFSQRPKELVADLIKIVLERIVE